MDMSEIDRSTAPSPAIAADAADGERWRDLVSAVGSETAAPLTGALERINALISTGRIDKTSLRALRDEVESARRAGMIAQQLARFASARLRQSHERLPLADTLQTVLTHRARETQARRIQQGEVQVTIEFPRTAHEQMEGVSTVELDQGFGLTSNSKPLAGSHVLVVASRREMRVRVRDAIRHMGLVIDLVSSLDEA